MKKLKTHTPDDEPWQTAYQWLKEAGNKIDSSYCKEAITTHPDYPALISVIDFLDSGRMEYIQR
jgi:hypothetical protein